MAKTKNRDRQQWTATEARGVLAACAASGLSMRAFAFREGIRPRRLYWWSKRLAGEHAGPVDLGALRFVPAVVKSDAPRAPGRAAITIRVGPNATLEFAESVSASWVAEVMTELERIACS